ncbi:MAG: helix-turn-helix domain-containing protein [Candidatus Omnitrophota bacterium]|nr:helix-turn-helix domain-containing protein [Candidatus Omnitrophota bacterium]
MMKRFLTSKEAADYLGIPESELNSLSGDKKIPVYKIGGIYTRFKVDELEAYRRKGVTGKIGKSNNSAIDNIRDFFYFNDFYIYSTLAIIVILYLIFKKS